MNTYQAVCLLSENFYINDLSIENCQSLILAILLGSGMDSYDANSLAYSKRVENLLEINTQYINKGK